MRIVFHITEAEEGLTATMDSPDQGVAGIPIQEVSYTNDTINLNMSSAGITFSGFFDKEERTIDGIFRQGGQAFPMILSEEAVVKEVQNRPQEPKAPFPYKVEEVQYKNESADIELAGSLTLPEGDGPFPIAVMISGSGAQDRDEALLGHKPFLVIADHLTRNGIAVLRFDDRGTAKSGGDHSTATSADFATDVQAGVDYLKTRKEIDPKKIGLIGHSEGGMIAPIVAANSSDIAFFVDLAGPGIQIDELLLVQSKDISLSQGISEEDIEENTQLSRGIFDKVKEGKEKSKDVLTEELSTFMKEEIGKMSKEDLEEIGDVDAFINGQLKTILSPWFRYFLGFNMQQHLAKVKCPVLAINGENDLQVDAKMNLEGIRKALKRGGNRDVTLKEMKGLNHLFQHSETGAISEYGEIEETFSLEVLELMTEWIKERMD